MDKKAVSSSGFSCSVCTLCRPLRCKALKSRLWQKDAPCQRLYLYSDLLLGCAFTVCRGNDRPAAIRSAQAHLFCAAVNEVRLCSPDELTVLEVLAALVHSQQLCNGHAAHLADDIYIQPAVVGLCFRRLSGLATGASWLCYYRALQEGPASVVVPIDKLSMLITIAFSYIVFHEKLTKKAAFGVVLITAGTILLAMM